MSDALGFQPDPVVRSKDLVARFGGEEFIALLAAPTADEVPATAERLRNAISGAPVHVGGLRIDVTVSVGGVWSICAPDMGTNAVLDRFRQIEPVVLIACDGVSYGGRDFDRLAVVAELRAALPTVRHVILHTNLAEDPAAVDRALEAAQPCTAFSTATARYDAATAAFEPLWLPFDHPLWIVYSSGTTGLPKPIVHGHGGTVIVAMALKIIHNDVGCSYAPNSWGERYHWYSSTGWVMWNAQTSGLLNGTTCVLYDGNPGGAKESPDWTTLWRFASELGVTFFGAGAAFFANCLKAGVDLSTCGDLSQVRALGTTGSPLSEDAQNWGTAQFAAIVDLCAELPCRTGAALTAQNYRSLPTLDLIVPDSNLLHEAANAIEQLRQQGPLLVCCALGYSRSASASCSVSSILRLTTSPIEMMPASLPRGSRLRRRNSLRAAASSTATGAAMRRSASSSILHSEPAMRVTSGYS